MSLPDAGNDGDSGAIDPDAGAEDAGAGDASVADASTADASVGDAGDEADAATPLDGGE